MDRFFEEDIERITEQTIELEVLEDIEALRRGGIREIDAIKNEGYRTIGNLKQLAIDNIEEEKSALDDAFSGDDGIFDSLEFSKAHVNGTHVIISGLPQRLEDDISDFVLETTHQYNYKLVLTDDGNCNVLADVVYVAPPAYAAIYGGDTMVFGRGDSIPSEYNGKALSSSYTGIEDARDVPLWNNDANVSNIAFVRFDATIMPASTRMWFRNFTSLVSIENIGMLDTGQSASMCQMFYNCQKLASIDTSGLDTKNVTDMSYMFYNNKLLQVLDLSNFNTSKVTNMMYMFYGASNLASLNVSGFNTENVYSMSGMFGICINLKSIDLTGFNTEGVQDITRMFYGCSNLTKLDVGSFNTKNVKYMNSSFMSCSKLTSLDLSTWNTNKVINMNTMFAGCMMLKTIYVSSLWDVSNVTSYTDIFGNCTALQGESGTSYNSLYAGDISYARIDGGASSPGYLSSLPDAYAAVYGGVILVFGRANGDDNIPSTYGDNNLELTASYRGIETESYDAADNMLPWLNHSENILEVRFDSTIKPISTAYWFYYMYQLQSISNIGRLDTSNVTNMTAMFKNCDALTSLDVTGFDTSNVTTMRTMFDSIGVTSLDLSSFNTTNVTDMFSMFLNCLNLKTIYVSSSFDVSNVTASTFMFSHDTKLVGGAGTVYDDTKTNVQYASIDGGASAPGYFTARQ